MANDSTFDTIGDILNYAYWYGITPAGATTSEIAAGIEVG